MARLLPRRLLPENQRRTLEELTAELDLSEGDTRSKRSAFWTMLTLSGIIASAGVLSDSTATVIGAMIIAPLSTPIMGTALALVKRERTGGLRYVVAGSALVVLMGVLFAFFLPGSYDLESNAQISGRTSPGALDLIAAIATGLAGAIALARRDVAAVLPGVAIAISLVPPLAVVGVCLGQGDVALAVGALTLFLSNFVALVLAGTTVFATLGYASEAHVEIGGPARRASFTLGLLLVLVAIPLVLNTGLTLLLGVWVQRVHEISDTWVAQVPGASVTGVEVVSGSILVSVRSPADLPDPQGLLEALEGEVPSGLPISIDESRGSRDLVGTVD
jgi:uncharacterized hydrophobic protein (TIGR00271 family)